jgi:GNAT superfamily N-acetyltransferase
MVAMPDSDLITSLDDPRLLDGIDHNVAEALAGLAATVGGEVYREPDFISYVTDIPDPLYNGIHAARFTVESCDARIAAALAPFKERGLPVGWLVNAATSRPANLGERLATLGLRPVGQSQGYAANISEVAAPLVQPGLMIERVKDESGAQTWAEIFTVAMKAPPQSVGLMHFIVKDALAQNKYRQAYYLAYLDGEPVATAALFCNGVAGIHSVATLPEARSRRIGSELTRWAALDAGRIGYRVAAANYRAQGAEFTTQIGFKVVAQYSRYLWTPPD